MVQCKEKYDRCICINGEGYKCFIAKKQSGNDNYILTFAVIAKN